jgi:hypothetical protein
LCYKCNEKWTKEHRCAPTVQLSYTQCSSCGNCFSSTTTRRNHMVKTDM